MFWRVWCFLAGIGPGVLGALAAAALLSHRPDDPTLAWLRAGGLGGGVVLLLVAHLLDRRPSDEPDRGARFARAASVGLVAWPAIAAARLQIAPGPLPAFVGVVALLAAAFTVAARRRVPAGGAGAQLGSALLAFGGGVLLVLLIGGVAALLRSEDPVPSETSRNAVFDHDATIDTVALPACLPTAERVRVVHDQGAHPRLDGTGEHLFFDAPGPDARRQVYRMVVATSEVACLTCDEPGNNRRPAPNAAGTSVAFDTDRHASWRRPGNTELHLLNTVASLRGSDSRRITFSPGADERAFFTPVGAALAWSRGEAGRYRAVTGALISGHGSLQVGGIAPLREGGAEWLAPVAWSPDARALVFARGNPLGPASLEAIDPATGQLLALGETAASSAALSFNADGGWYALATATRAAPAGLLPHALGFFVAPALAVHDAEDRDVFRGTTVSWGPTREGGNEVDLGESADWGSPTGISLEPDGAGFFLGQRRSGEDGIEERIVHAKLACESS